MADGGRQINFRVTPEQHAVLAAAAFVHDVSAMSLAKEALERELAQLAKLPSVVKALEARADQVAAGSGKVSRLRATE
jgi:uncharacterized protein (DUF1778 family)